MCQDQTCRFCQKMKEKIEVRAQVRLKYNAPDWQSPDNTALLPSDIRGFRYFYLRQDGSITAINGTPFNNDGSLVADCRKGKAHNSPDPDCKCGIYASYTHEHQFYNDAWVRDISNFIYKKIPYVYLTDDVTALLYGSIRASGDIVLAEKGFRAEKAKIEALSIVSPYRNEAIDVLARTWHRKLALYPHIEVLKLDYPNEDMSGLLDGQY